MKKCSSSFPSLKVLQLFCLYGILLTGLLVACRGKEEKRIKVTRVKYKETNALTLIRKDDCLTCHSIEDKSVGPSYVRISQRYEADVITVNKLADKIIAGGGGLWGGMMTKHPFLKKEDAVKIVRWILSLDDSISNPDPMLNTPGITLAKTFIEDVHIKAENGLIVKSYRLESLDDYGAGFPEIRQEITPLYSGIIKKIHLPDEESFEPLRKDFVLQATGFIHIKTKGKYFFKQVRTGKGRVFLNGEKKINENDWDSEITIDLSPGIYPITIEYLPGKGDKSLSLQWITPEDEYYEVIPEEAFTYY